MPELEVLEERLRSLGRVVVAFCGGADSAFLAWVAHRTLGPDACAVATAVSPSLAGDERADCAALAAEWGLRWREVAHHRARRPRLRGQRRRPLLPLQDGADGRARRRWPTPTAPPWCSA